VACRLLGPHDTLRCFLIKSFNETKQFLQWKCQPTSLPQIPNFNYIMPVVSKIWIFENWLSSSFFLHFILFFFLLRCENCHKTQKHNLTALKFGTLKGWIRVHTDTRFACNTINGHKAIDDYLRKITPIWCHAYRVNHYNGKMLKIGKEIGILSTSLLTKLMPILCPVLHSRGFCDHMTSLLFIASYHYLNAYGESPWIILTLFTKKRLTNFARLFVTVVWVVLFLYGILGCCPVLWWPRTLLVEQLTNKKLYPWRF